MVACAIASIAGAQRAPAWAADLALDRPANASSTERGLAQFAPALANDGDSATRWSSAYTDNQWWEVDLGSDRTINRVELNWEVAYASRYRILTRRYGSNVWSTAASGSIDSPGLKVHTFEQRSARYVQVRGDARATPWGISLWDARVCDNNTCGTPAPEPTPNPPPVPNPTAPTLRQVDGGLGYYGQFSNPLSVSPNHFPIGVWGAYGQFSAERNLDAQIGINTYVWAADANLWDDIAGDSRFDFFGGHGNRGHANRGLVNGWLLHDEIDMSQGPGACTGAIPGLKASLPADGTVRYANYGKGIFPGWESDSQFACFVNSQNVTSDDIYWFTDPNACRSISEGPSFFGLNRALTQAECRRAANYGYVVDRMRQLDVFNGSPRHPIWNFVEVSHPFSEAGQSISGAQSRAAVWHSIIAGARGIIYFQHTFQQGHACYGHHHTLRDNCHGMRQPITDLNAQIKRLAPVLNAPFADGLVSTTAQVRTMAKYQGGKFYVFAGNKESGARTATFDVPCVGNATVTVVDEGRTIPLTGGRFTDSFADGNAVHIYRIDGGSTCGLTP